MSERDPSSGAHRTRTALGLALAAALALVIAAVWLLPGRLDREPPSSVPASRPGPSAAPQADRAPGPGAAEGAVAPARPPARPTTPSARGTAPDVMPPPGELARMTNFDKRQFFDRRAARASGLSEAEVDRLYERWLAAELAIHSRIEADHANGRRVRPGTRSYDAALREFLDDDEFDVALYATNQMNRVHLSAPAEGGRPMAEGLQPGDIIESYDGEHVYRLVDLQLMIKSTSPDETVPVVVRRGGEMIVVEVPGRHPLGPKTPQRTTPAGR